jgi:hypothetical protein
MTQAELFLAELDREAPRSKRALEQLPEGKADWKPHDKSMPFGYLAELVATMPRWIVYAIERDELNLTPQPGQGIPRETLNSRADYLGAHDRAVADARKTLQKTSDEFLLTHWKLIAGGNVVMDQPRYIVIRETFNHLAHHRGQMTVYLRLLGAKVPAIYGPSADDRSFS